MKTTIHLLNVGDYTPEITALTYPLIRCYAARIGVEIFIIKERKSPNWTISYEKLQIFDLAREHRLYPVCLYPRVWSFITGSIWRPTDGTMMSIFSEMVVRSAHVIGLPWPQTRV